MSALFGLPSVVIEYSSSGFTVSENCPLTTVMLSMCSKKVELVCVMPSHPNRVYHTFSVVIAAHAPSSTNVTVSLSVLNSFSCGRMLSRREHRVSCNQRQRQQLQCAYHWLCAHAIFSITIEKSVPSVSVTYDPP